MQSKENFDNSFLKECNTIRNTYISLKEGKTHININTTSKNKLGKLLSFWYPIKTETIFGTVGNLQLLSWYITKPDFPKEWLNVDRLKKNEIIMIKKMKINFVPNYWAILAYVITNRLFQEKDKTTLYLLRDNKLPLTIYKSEYKKEPYNNMQDVEITKLLFKLANYVAIIRRIEVMIKEDIFLPSNVNELIMNCKFYKDKALLDGVNREHEILPEGLS